MSDKPIYITCWYPSENAIQENGARRLAYAFPATHEKQARAKATLDFMEQFPDADDSDFEIKICRASNGIPCPEIRVWDEKHLYVNDWNDELNCLVPKEQETATYVDFDKLSLPLRIAVLVMYQTTKITTTQLSAAISMQQDESNSFDSHIVDAIAKTPAIPSMYPDRILEAITFVRENCSPTKKWPEIKAALAGWIKHREEERKEPHAEVENAGAVAVPRPYEHTFKTLDIEIAIALWAGDVNPNAPLASVTRWANEIIKDDREDWKRWSMQLRSKENILKYDRPTIFNVVRNVPAADTYKFPESHGRYISEYLKAQGKMENPSDETEQNEEGSAGSLADEQTETGPVASNQPDAEITQGGVEAEPPVERTGPFYYRCADGNVGRANKLAKLETVIAQGCEEITKEEYQALKDAPPPQKQNTDVQPEVRNLGNGRFAVDGLEPDQQLVDPAESADVVQAQPEAPVFQSIAADLEKDLAEKGDNLRIWRSVMRTDPRYTKDLAGAGFEGTSINAEYMVMRATEIFGPIGTGWGFEVMEDRMIPGAPLSEAIYEDKKFIGNRMLRDADGSLITELNHSIKIGFWYLTDIGSAERFEAYGATKYLYKTKHGITCDGEAHKKSLTDAIKKALSLLGFSADVWLGLYDQAEYKQENAIEFDIRNASDKAEDVTRIRKELDEKFKQNTDSMRSAVTPNEISGIASSLTRVMGVHLKAAREKADAEYTKYLEGRLRRLEEVKTECLTKLQEKAA